MFVQLIVTGDVERLALTASLARALPPSIEWLPPLKTDPCTTAARDPSAPFLPTPFQRLARQLVAAALGPVGKGAPTADLVIAIDDLELYNAGHPERVAACVARAVDARLDEQFPSRDARDRNAATVRAKCSFHLIAPLLEALFFGDPALLGAHGWTTTAGLERTSLTEAFHVAPDPDYRAWAGYDATRPEWFDAHPKQYLEFISSQHGPTYQETTQGRELLLAMPWTTLGAHATELALTRSLFEDLAAATGTPSPLGAGPTHDATWPPIRVRRESLTLRNL